MAIYGRTGDVVKLKRYAVLEEVRRLDKRRPDKRDSEALACGSYVIVEQDDGREVLYHQAYLRADGGAREIGEVLDGFAVQPGQVAS